jgi:ABC-type bacteriocin/lantibiotic exporter with double-glycine peptidase domain
MESLKVMEIYIWILTGLIGFILPILLMIAAGTIKKLNQKLDEFVEAIQQLNIINTRNIEQIKTLYSNKTETDAKLTDHETRIRTIEIKCKRL